MGFKRTKVSCCICNVKGALLVYATSRDGNPEEKMF